MASAMDVDAPAAAAAGGAAGAGPSTSKGTNYMLPWVSQEEEVLHCSHALQMACSRARLGLPPHHQRRNCSRPSLPASLARSARRPPTC